VDELVIAKILAPADFDRAVAVATQQIHVHLVSGDRPDPANRRYNST
jgi:hypothetical protein